MGSGAAASSPFVESGIAVIADTGWDRCALRWRSASTQPSGLFGRLVPSPAMTLRAAATASRGSDLPSLRRTLRLGRGTSRTSYPAAVRRRARAAPNEFVPSTPTAATLPGPGSMPISLSYPSGSAVNVSAPSGLPRSSSNAMVCVSVWVSIPAHTTSFGGVIVVVPFHVFGCLPGACGADRTLTRHATMVLAGSDGSGHAPMRSCIHGPRVGGHGRDKSK